MEKNPLKTEHKKLNIYYENWEKTNFEDLFKYDFVYDTINFIICLGYCCSGERYGPWATSIY